MDREYPHGFPLEFQTRVEVEKLLAAKDAGLTEQVQDLPFTELEHRALRWVCRVLGTFAHQACELGKANVWTVMQIRHAVDEFRLQLIQTAHFKVSGGRLGWVDRVFGTYIRPEVRAQIESSEEWLGYQDGLLEVGRVQIASPQFEANDLETDEPSQSATHIAIRRRNRRGAGVETTTSRTADPENKQSPPAPVSPKVDSPEAKGDVIAERAARRQAVVNPLLNRKRWRTGRLATESGVGKATVYGYLRGTRAWIRDDNRRAMAECLGLKPNELPD